VEVGGVLSFPFSDPTFQTFLEMVGFERHGTDVEEGVDFFDGFFGFVEESEFFFVVVDLRVGLVEFFDFLGDVLGPEPFELLELFELFVDLVLGSLD